MVFKEEKASALDFNPPLDIYKVAELVLDFSGFTYMRGSASIPLARSIRKQFYPIQGSWGGIVPSLEPKKLGNEETDKGKTIADEKVTEPIVAFSRPPPLPSFLGPLVALSFLESWSRNDSNDA